MCLLNAQNRELVLPHRSIFMRLVRKNQYTTSLCKYYDRKREWKMQMLIILQLLSMLNEEVRNLRTHFSINGYQSMIAQKLITSSVMRIIKNNKNHDVGWENISFKYSEVSMLVHGCGDYIHTQLYDEIGKPLKMSPRSYIGKI